VQRAQPAPAAAPTGEIQPLSADNWNGIVGTLAGVPRQLASNCAFLRREGAVVHLALDPAKQVLLTRASEDKLAQALTRACGTPLRLAIEVVAPPADTPARVQVRQADAELQAARERLAGDPAVQALQQRFGASMLPDSVRMTRHEES
jgi:DNA polymerase-3 subunit gamma/tau